ncbi:MAG: cytochrome c assembly protein, partial [Bacteroidetes bacterium]
GHSIRSTYLFYLLAFVLVVYSTFLTRSGILGDSSVHAFTEMGLETQLVSFIVAMMLVGFGLLAWKYRRVPAPAKEEPFASREFWMFIGSLVLFFSAAMITAATSLPVYNKIRQAFDPVFEGLTITEPVPFYNRYQLWIAVFIGLLSGIAQFLRYRERNFEAWRTRFFKHVMIASLAAIALTVVNALWINLFAWQYVLLCFAACFAITSNLDYLIAFLKANLKEGASAIAHIGFGVMIVGILASGLNKHHISKNPFAMRGLVEGATEEDLARNVVLIKNAPLLLPESGYEAEYLGDTIVGHKRTFFVEFRKRDEAGRVAERFLLTPNILYDKNFEKVAASNPSTRRYWNKDIFTHIAWLPAPEISIEEKKAAEDSLDYQPYVARIGDTIYTSKVYAIVKGMVMQPTHRDYHPQPGDYAMGLQIEFHELDADTAWLATPVVVLRGNLMYQYP